MKALTAKELSVLERATPPRRDEDVVRVPDYRDFRSYILVCHRLVRRGLLLERHFATRDRSEGHIFFVLSDAGRLALVLQRALDMGVAA